MHQLLLSMEGKGRGEIAVHAPFSQVYQFFLYCFASRPMHTYFLSTFHVFSQPPPPNQPPGIARWKSPSEFMNSTCQLLNPYTSILN
jgi:hypothetical protein